MSDKTFIAQSNQFVKFDDSRGLIFGFAIVCKQDGEPYEDLQGDHIPEDSMLEAAAEFMQNSRVGAVMHKRNEDGSVVQEGSIPFCFPLTGDIAKSLGIETGTTGLLIGFKSDDPETLAKARSGEYRGFSIGGELL